MARLLSSFKGNLMLATLAAFAHSFTAKLEGTPRPLQGGQPWRGTAGAGGGSSRPRGNRNVQRAAIKTRNRSRHRAACRGG